ncbi:MAG: hypothetical protein ACFFD2_21860 [Promethearchaeota archaeon]
MDESMQDINQKLNTIIMKLDTMIGSITGLTKEIQKTSSDFIINIKQLTKSIEKDIDIMTEHSREGFEHSREQLIEVTKEINILRRITGTGQIFRANQALIQILTLLERAIDPNAIQKQLNEILQFIKVYGEVK